MVVDKQNQPRQRPALRTSAARHAVRLHGDLEGLLRGR